MANSDDILITDRVYFAYIEYFKDVDHNTWLADKTISHGSKEDLDEAIALELNTSMSNMVKSIKVFYGETVKVNIMDKEWNTRETPKVAAKDAPIAV